jgi:membrane-associated phospholipid phosphatase
VTVYRRRPRTDGVALGVALVLVATTAAVAHSGRVSTPETWVFHRINDLPDLLYRPMWLLQFAGLLLTPVVPLVVAAWFRRWRLVAGLAVLIPLKLAVERGVLKQLVDRRRPATSICDRDLSCLNLRGDVPIGTPSFPSGHAVIVWGIVWLVLPYLPRRWMRATAIGVGVGVMVARVYLGAHNPLDVVCGAALGVVIGSTWNLLVGVPAPGSGDATDSTPDERGGVAA